MQGELRTFMLTQALAALSAIYLLPRWAERAELWILSNHHHEWLLTRLEAAGATGLFERALVSGQIGAQARASSVRSPGRAGRSDGVRR